MIKLSSNTSEVVQTTLKKKLMLYKVFYDIIISTLSWNHIFLENRPKSGTQALNIKFQSVFFHSCPMLLSIARQLHGRETMFILDYEWLSGPLLCGIDNPLLFSVLSLT